MEEFPTVLVIGQLPPPVHGSNVMTERFMDSLNAIGVTSAIVEKKFSEQLEDVGKRNPRKLLKVPNLYRDVCQAITKVKPDLCIYFISVGLASLLVDSLILELLYRKKVSYVLYVHGKGYKKYESNLVFKKVVQNALRKAVGAMVLGDSLKNDINHCIPNDRLYVLPNAIPALPPDLRRQRDRIKEKPYVHVIFLSNLIPDKGPMVVLNLAKIMMEKDLAVKFTLAGRATSSEYLNRLKAFIKEFGLEDIVKLAGPVYGEEKTMLLDSADIFIFPTSFPKETFGIVNLEAIQWGIPVISSPIGAIPEIIEDGVNGFIVDPTDLDLLTKRLVALVSDQEMRHRVGENGIRIFDERYSLEAYRKNLESAMIFFKRINS